MTPEAADKRYEWTDEALELSARAELITAQMRRADRFDSLDEITGEEALLWVVAGGEAAPELQERIDERVARLRQVVVGKLPGERVETRAEAARRRYRENPEFRARVLAETRRRRAKINADPKLREEQRAKERERKRKARAAARAAK